MLWRSHHIVAKGALTRIFLRRASDTVLDSLEPIENFTRQLIDASAAGDNSYNHRNAARLWSAIPQANLPTQLPPSMEKAQFLTQNPLLTDQAEPLDSDVWSEAFSPGTFVELRRNRIVTHGIVLKLAVLESRRHSFTLTYTGEVWPHLTSDITYTIPNFVSQDLLERAGDGYETFSTTQTAARLQIVEQIRTFTRQHERHFNSLAKDVRQLYDKLRNRDSDQWTDITTPEVAKFVDVRKTPPVLTLFAIHTHLMSLPLYYVADPRNHKTSHQFAIRPLSHVQTILQVNDWVRKQDPVFQSFVQTARQVIKRSREIKETSWDASPGRFHSILPPWSPTDLIFINFLQNALRTTRTIQDDPYDRALPTMIKAIDMYSDFAIDPGLAPLVLGELGVLPPWEDVIMRSPELRLDIAPPGESREATTLNEYVQHAITKRSAPISPILQHKFRDIRLEGSTELYPRDPLEAQRHDFGDIPVYIVDDDLAQELDDGISIEDVPGEPGNYWVHVHVADPTAVIPPGHVLDLQAKKAVTTIYSSHRTWAMLPSGLTKPLFSLGAKSESSGQEVLTFSLKMSDSAKVLDYHVRAGIVHNMHILTYDQVDRLLGLKHSYHSYPFRGNDQPTVSRGSVSVPETCHSDLQKLRDLADRFFRDTLNMYPVFTYNLPKAEVEFPKSLPISPFLPPRPILWKGYPSMTYVIEEVGQIPNSFRQTVAEWMKLAGRAASRFCRDRGIPALRRANQRLQAATPADTEFLLAARDPNGFVDPFECLRRSLYAPAGEPTLAPRAHFGMGIPDGEGYTRVTSPLRRYSDLMMHWQIKHALIPGNDQPLFSEEYLQPIMFRLYEKEKASLAAEKVYHKHWSLTYLDRYIQGERRKHGPNYEPFPGLLARTTGSSEFDVMNATGQVPVIVPSLGVHGQLKGVDTDTLLPIGTTFAVKITHIKLGVPSTLQLGLA